MKNFTFIKLLLLAVCMQCSSMGWALNQVVQDGVVYSIVDAAARVDGLSGEQHRVSIRPEVVYQGVAYPVTSIADGAFQLKSSLEQVIFPASLERIGRAAFSQSGLTSAVFPASLRELGALAFAACPRLVSVQFAPGLERIGNDAFASCAALSSVQLSEGLQHIGISAFADCTALDSLAFPIGLLSIQELAFVHTGLKSAYLPSTVAELGPQAFARCANLQRVVLPDALQDVPMGAFRDCAALTHVRFPEDLAIIGPFAFSGTALTILHLPATLQQVGANAFHEVPLQQVYCAAIVPPVLGGEVSLIGLSCAFSDYAHQHATLYVPQGYVNVYRQSTEWKDFLCLAEFLPSGISRAVDSELQIRTERGKVIFQGLPTGTPTQVYSLSGTCVYSGPASRICGLPHGTYVVHAGGHTARISF